MPFCVYVQIFIQSIIITLLTTLSTRWLLLPLYALLPRSSISTPACCRSASV